MWDSEAQKQGLQELSVWERWIWRVGVQGLKDKKGLKAFGLLEQEMRALMQRWYQKDPDGLVSQCVKNEQYEWAHKWGCAYDSSGTHVSVLALQDAVEQASARMIEKGAPFWIKHAKVLMAQSIERQSVLEYLQNTSQKMQSSSQFDPSIAQCAMALQKLTSALEQACLGQALRAKHKAPTDTAHPVRKGARL